MVHPRKYPFFFNQEINAFTRKYIILSLTLNLGSDEALYSTFYIMRPMHLQSLKLLRPTVYDEIHLQENALFDV